MGVLQDLVVRIEYPDTGFAFNPISVLAGTLGGTPIRVELILSDQNNQNPFSVIRDTLYANNRNQVYFDLQGIAKSLFSESRTWTTPQVDNVLYKTFQLRAYRYDSAGERIQVGGIGYISVVWGALQIGQQFKHYQRLTYFKGKPFTFPLYTFGDTSGNPLTMYQREDEGSYATIGQIAPGKYNFPIMSQSAERRIVARFDKQIEAWQGIYDNTFDHTFQGFTDSSFFVYMDVVPCEEEGVYLRWVGRQGEWFYYNFKRVSRGYTTTDMTPFIEQNYTSIDVDPGTNYHPGTGGPIGKNEQEIIQVSAPLIDTDHYDYIEQVIGSPRVDILVDNPDGSVANAKWVRVGTSVGTFTRTNEPLQDFTFNVILPVTQNQHF